MKTVPPEVEFTREQLQKKINTTRRLMFFMSKNSRMPKTIYGKEMFFETPEGRIRILAYNMDKQERLPLYVNVHGGGFTAASAESDDKYMKEVAEKANIKIINVDYSLAPENPFPKALNECYEATKYAIAHADVLGIDPDKIAIGGHSAGGNLSAAVCLKDAEMNELNIKGLIVDYAPLDIYTDAYLKPSPKGAIPPQASRVADPSYCHKKEDRKNPLVSPVFATGEQVKYFPPTLVITASRDSLCEEGEKFKDLLVDAGVKVTFKRFEGKHGFTHSGGPDADEAWIMMINHLKEGLWDCYTNEKVILKCKKSSGKVLMNLAAALSITLAIIINILFLDLDNAANVPVLLTLVKINVIFLPLLIILSSVINGLKKSELSVSDRRIYGCAAFGKRVDLPLDSTTSIEKSVLKGLNVTTASGTVKFKLISNTDELIAAIRKLIAKKKPVKAVPAT